MSGELSALQKRLGAIDSAIYRVEQKLVGAMMAAMAAAMFGDVVHRVFSRSPGRLSVFLAGSFGDTPESWDALASPVIIVMVTLAVVYFALATRWRGSSRGAWATLGVAAISTAVLSGLVLGFVRFVPEGIVWAPYFSLSLLLWVGLVGASLATYSSRHLALEMGEKIWPKKMRPRVKALSQIVAGLFCLMLAVLAGMSTIDHLEVWMDAPDADLIPSVDLPKWAVFSVIPYAFGMMTLRFVGRALGLVPTPPPASELGVPAGGQEAAE